MNTKISRRANGWIGIALPAAAALLLQPVKSGGSPAPLTAQPPETAPPIRRSATEPAGNQENLLHILQRHGKRNARVHDPSSIVQCGDHYWLFATGMGIQSWRSADLADWERGPRVIADLPPWVNEVVPTQRGHFWAPDITFQRGRFLLYYSVSRFGRNTSAIALVSNPILDPADPQYRWSDHGVVIQSREQDNFNAIDPAIVRTREEELWMVFGSFWSGIKLIQLDPATGLRISPNSPIYSLASHDAIEAPHIHARKDFYYLFVNWGACCRGVNSTYNIRVGRSRLVTGPYLDKDGKALLEGGGTLFLSTDGPFIGPGHASIFRHDNQDWFSCHFYDGTERGRSRLALHRLNWSEDGWPAPVMAAPVWNEPDSSGDRIEPLPTKQED